MLTRTSRAEGSNLKMTPLEFTQFLEESCFAGLFEPNSQSMQKPIEGRSVLAVFHAKSIQKTQRDRDLFFHRLPTRCTLQKTMFRRSIVHGCNCLFLIHIANS